MNIFDKDYYQDLCVSVLSKAKTQGATSAEVSIAIDAGFSVSSRLGQIETIQHQQDKGLHITVFFGQQTGSSSTSDLSLSALDTAITKACSIAKFTNTDPCAGLADRLQMAFDYPDLNLDHPWVIDTKQALELAIECENLAMTDSRIVNSDGASIDSHRSLLVYGNTQDFIGAYFSTQHSMNCVLIAEQNGKMHRDYDYTVARSKEDLLGITELAESVRNKTIRRLGARRLKTCSAPVIFSAEIARGLLGNLVSAISGGQIYRKSSFLVDHLGKQILPDHVSLTQYPHLTKAMGSAPFDSEGVCTKQCDFIKEGILQNYILSSYSARKLGMKTTGNAGGVHNLIINTNGVMFTDLLRQMDTGLLVTELIGQGINLVDGNYSRGAFGYWVEKGEIIYPVEEVTIAGNLRDMFKNIIAVSNDVDKRGRIQTGSLLIENMTIAGE